MQETDLHYPPQTCPFCTIAAAFPFPSSPSTSSSPNSPPPTPSLWKSSRTQEKELLKESIPKEEESDPEKTNPSSFVVLRSKDVVAFLDILPMTGGHLLVTTRHHKVKVADMEAVESKEIGFWLPILARTVAKVTGVTDYNIVQNNGARAAQVVPHVHFHIIPRPETMPEIKNKSWTMFGRGQRDDLDDEEGAKMAGEMRRVLREEVEKMGTASAKL
ncbi:HIT-like domain-containing protein [Alternaria rosae]|uniref:HIT-like domain-containing protein n=1 Tax=Alternaria rosae TaxID=1187941 RepID=UPI001E8D5548|nr:HIT-like domain-containing protein [Alternaria rosae]KAH6860916.1 HIT-like domain-containing protein [Alternaria rosae]